MDFGHAVEAEFDDGAIFAFEGDDVGDGGEGGDLEQGFYEALLFGDGEGGGFEQALGEFESDSGTAKVFVGIPTIDDQTQTLHSRIQTLRH